MEQNNNTRSVQMTDAEFAAYKAYKEQQQAEEQKQAAKKQREDYRQLVDDTIAQMIPHLKGVSADLKAQKKAVFDVFATILEMKNEMFQKEKGEALDNLSHTFTHSDGTMRIVLGNYTVDGYLDTAEEGIEKVKNYISSLAKDSESQALVSMVMKLLSKDAKGTLKASRIIQLRKMAEETGNAEFIEGVHIIEESYRPQTSRTFLKAYFKNPETGGWDQIPLGMTEA